MSELLVRDEIALLLEGSKTNTVDHKARAYERACYCLYMYYVLLFIQNISPFLIG